MERRRAAPNWRASFGFGLTALAAVLLGLALWQAFRLSADAGTAVDALNREQSAVQFEHTLMPLFVDLNRYRVRTQMAQAAPHYPGLRRQIENEIGVTDAQARATNAQFHELSDWEKVQRDWSKAQQPGRSAVQGSDAAVRDLGQTLLYNLEDVSGLQYETDHSTQDLADIYFAKLPAAIAELMHSDFLAENAQAGGTLSIPNRIVLARLIDGVSTDQGDLDLTTDEWSAVLQDARREGIASAADVIKYERNNATMRAAGDRFTNTVNAQVVVRSRPVGNAVKTRANADAAVSAALAMSEDIYVLLDRQIAYRTGVKTTHDRYVYAAAACVIVLVIGIMLFVAELTARRNRLALQKAQQESERLSVELARQTAERALRLSEAQFRAVFDGAALGIAILDRNQRVVDANTVFRHVYGEGDPAVLEGHETEFAELMRGESDLFEFEQHVMTPSGHEAWTDVTVSLVNDDGGHPLYAMCTFRDLTDLKRSERRMLHDMTHDTLTGLPNRALFETKVREQFLQLKISPESSFAVLFIDLDRFKDINESLGHDAGDFVISQVANRLRASIESADVVARLGSDEFSVLVQSLPDVLHVEVIARRILSALSKPIALGSRSIFVSASIGIAIGSATYQRGEDIMRDADIAMRHAKVGGGTRVAVFDSRMHARAQKRLQLTTDLRLALDRGEFDLVYQPIVKIADGELVGCEALLRWNHPVEGVIGPMDFMPLAEQTGLAVPIGRFVLRTACAQSMRWKRMTGRQRVFPINVNVSAPELLDPEFESTLFAVVRESGVDPSDLMLEITESVILDSGTRPNAMVERLRSQGFGICIDDFGTGYSSLRYLQQFKVDAIKIDRSFVAGQDGDVASEPIVRTLMTLAEAFDVRVVAEGIETQRQRDVLRNVGCRFGQGYYYSRGIGADELAAMYPSIFGISPRHASA